MASETAWLGSDARRLSEIEVAFDRIPYPVALYRDGGGDRISVNNRFRELHGLSPSDCDNIGSVVSSGGRESSIDDVEELVARAAALRDARRTRRTADDSFISVREVFSKRGFVLAVENAPRLAEAETGHSTCLLVRSAIFHFFPRKRRETEQFPASTAVLLEIPKHLRAGFTFDKELNPIFGVSG